MKIPDPQGEYFCSTTCNKKIIPSTAGVIRRSYDELLINVQLKDVNDKLILCSNHLIFTYVPTSKTYVLNVFY